MGFGRKAVFVVGLNTKVFQLFSSWGCYLKAMYATFLGKLEPCEQVLICSLAGNCLRPHTGKVQTSDGFVGGLCAKVFVVARCLLRST